MTFTELEEDSGNLKTYATTANNEDIVSKNCSTDSGGDLSSCTLTTFYFVDDWEWENVVPSSELWDEKEYMCSWLWAPSNYHGKGERHKVNDNGFEGHNPMIAANASLFS